MSRVAEKRPPGKGPAMTLRLVRRETRGDLPLLACLAVLVLVLAALCAWAPALAGRQEDRALRQRVEAAQAQTPLVTMSTTPAVFNGPQVDIGRLLGAGRTLTARLGAPAAAHLTPEGDAGYDYSQAALTSPRPPDHAVTGTQLALSYLPSAREHLRWVGGHAPADSTPKGGVPQVALSQATAAALGVGTGSRLAVDFAATPDVQDTPPHVTLLVSGIYLPTGGAGGYWTGRESLDRPTSAPAERSAGTVLSARGLVGRDTADVLSTAGVRGPLVTWQLRADLRGAALDEARALSGPLAGYASTLNAELCQGQGTDFVTGDVVCTVAGQATGSVLVVDSLTPLLASFTARDQQARALAAFAVDALAAVVLATVVVAVRLLLLRRRAHLRLQRARGASTARLVLVRCAVAWTVIPVAALAGWAVGRGLAPGGTSGAARPLPAAVAAAVVAATVPLMTWLAVREPRRPGRLRPTRRRTAALRRAVLELTVLLAAAAGVVALRSQGPDGILGAVPVLVALAVVLVLLRCYPLALRLLLRQTRRGRGTVGFVGAARAAHDAPATGLALFVLVLTLGTAVFGGLVQRTIGDGLAGGAAWAAGADASATASGHVTPAGAAPGMRTAVQQVHTVSLVGQADGALTTRAAVITVDPGQLVAVAPRSPLARVLLAGLGPTPAGRPDARTPLPSFLSADLRASERTGGFTTSLGTEGKPTVDLTFTPVGTLTPADLRDPLLGPVTARIPAGTPLVVTTATADRLMPPQSTDTTVLLLRGESPATAAPAALRSAATRALGPLARIRVRAEELSALHDDGLTRGLGTLYTAASALAALSGLLALALELALTAHERGRTTAFLRTLGLGGREAGALHLLQLLPLAVASAVGGTVLGLLEPRLTARTLDLRQFTGGPAQPALRTDYGLLVALVAGVTALVLAAAATETVLARRRRLGAALRLS